MPTEPFKSLLVILAISVAVYGAWKIAYPSATWRYKLTVEIDTPEGVKRGSAVREIKARLWPKITPESNPIELNIKGEAVVINLNARDQVFALLPTYKSGSDGWYYILYRAFPMEGSSRERIRYYSNLKAGPKQLDAGEYPVFVRFPDPADPKTVENLLEMQACPDTSGAFRPLCVKNDRFAEAFGAGVALKSVTIEMTREPVTTSVVEKFLPWLPARKGKRGTLGGGDSITEDPTGTWLTGEEFSMGVYW